MRVGAAGKRERGKSSWLGRRWRAFLLIQHLLRDRSAGKRNGDAVVRVNMVERALTGRQGQMNDDHGVIFQYHAMKRLVFHGHRRRTLLRSEQEGRGKN